MASDFRYLRRVQFHETDLAGVVHFAHYFRFMEEAEHALLRALDVPVQRREGDGLLGFPRGRASCDFRAPLRFGDEVEVRLVVRERRSRSLTWECVLRRVGDGVEVARGQMTCIHAAISADGTMQALPLPAALVEKLAPFEEPAAGQ